MSPLPPPTIEDMTALLLELRNKRSILIKMIALLKRLLEEEPFRDERDEQ